MKHTTFDVVVVGAGHAGTEAAHAAWRMGASVALITFRKTDIGVMSCNPAIGGLGKGHLVREIDALDGVMGRVADKAAIQFRLLNRRKGPAVRGPRVQADRALYQAAMMQEVDEAIGLTVIEAEVVDLKINAQGAVTGVELADQSEVSAKTVILTSGTFLRGLMHIGDQKTVGGRNGAQASVRLAERVRNLDVRIGRLKTGTPPRLLASTIDFRGLEVQDGDEDPSFFSFMPRGPMAPQVSCAITHTNSRTHDIIRSNLERSAMYGGMIDGTGPRYCPSIEDKVVRFAEKDSHQIFLEPESLTSDLIYPNGISTSLPAEIQADYVRSIKGLESAEIAQPGYAIEYDFVDPRSLSSGLGLPTTPGLFLAGQINGTTGYEEAAAQGLVAGINAVRFARKEEPVRFSRSNSYIGVMIDDLTTRGVTEPYRMFTSRAEYRLLLRADNADQRLTPIGVKVGCVTRERKYSFTMKNEDLSYVRRTLEGQIVSEDVLRKVGLGLKEGSGGRSGFDALRIGECDVETLIREVPAFTTLSVASAKQVQCDAIYDHYIQRQKREIESVQANEGLTIPPELDFNALEGLSWEVRGKLGAVRPETLAQAARIEGVTSAAIVTLLAVLKRNARKSV